MKLANNPELLDQTLTEIALALTDDQTDVAMRQAAFAELQKKSSKIDLDHPHALAIYGEILGKFGQYNAAFEKFEQALRIRSDDIDVLNNYGLVLVKSGQYEAAIDKFEQALQIDPKYDKALNNYGVALSRLGYYEAAIEKFEQVLQINPKDANALTGFGAALSDSGQYEAAIEKFKRALVIDPGRPNTLFLYAEALAKQRNYRDAISRLEKISLDKLSQDNANLVYLTLAQLHSLNRSKIKGNEYFELAIQNSVEKDAKKIAEAQRIFAKDPYSEEGVAILKEIRETSPRYAQAFKLLSLNLSPKDYYQMFSIQAEDMTLQDTEMLNRAMYHKIANEISILKSMAYRISYNGSDKNGVLSEIIEAIENIPDQIKKRREASQIKVKAIPTSDYESVLETIAETAYDISDLVNNELAVIESKVRRMLRQLSPGDPTYPQCEKLLAQLEFTQTALNDLKAINEDITIRYHRFYVKELFEKWVEATTLGNATITLDIQNGQSEFNGDAEKIKSALNELVENSLKHNPDQTDLIIQMKSYDIINPPAIRSRWIPGDQRYLCIIFSDNGRGIPSGRKGSIFLPLKTTSTAGTGSGLGLFIIRKTVTKMRGYILETGEQGAKFEIYLPYGAGKLNGQ
jgi:Tfp pilus assembly protein PilF/signal transduction histidine kinase